MTSQVDLLDMMESRRERSGSANSIISIPSESGKDCRLYEAMVGFIFLFFIIYFYFLESSKSDQSKG